jgi:hypothetical protein
MIKFLVGKKMDISKNLLWIFSLILILNLILSLGGCPFIGITGAISTGKGWHTDVVIHNGVIHTARYNFDDISVEYAYKSLTEDTWHVETVEKYSGDKRACVRDVQYDGLLKMVVDDKAVYIAYAGLLTSSIKLAKRPHSEGEWNIEHIMTPDIRLGRPRVEMMEVISEDAFILHRWSEMATSFLSVKGNSGVQLYSIDEPFSSSIIYPDYMYIACCEDYSDEVKVTELSVIDGKAKKIKDVFLSPNTTYYILDLEAFKISENRIGIIFLGRDLHDERERSLRIRYFIGEKKSEDWAWSITEIPFPEISKESIIYLLQVRYRNDKLFLLFKRLDEEDFKDSEWIKKKFGVGIISGGSLNIDWIEVPGNIESAKFDVSPPYIVISLLSVNEGTIRRKCREDGLPMAYKNYKGTHMIYIFDGKTWRKEVVK